MRFFKRLPFIQLFAMSDPKEFASKTTSIPIAVPVKEEAHPTEANSAPEFGIDVSPTKIYDKTTEKHHDALVVKISPLLFIRDMSSWMKKYQVGKTLREWAKQVHWKEQVWEPLKDWFKTVKWGEVWASVKEGLDDVDWKEVRSEINEGIKKVDWNEVRNEIKDGMKEVDWASVKEGLSEVNWKEVRGEIEDGMKEVDWASVKEGLDDVSWNEVQSDVNGVMKEFNWDEAHSSVKEVLNEVPNINNEGKRQIESLMASVKEGLKDLDLEDRKVSVNE